MAATSSLAVALKSIGLGGILKGATKKLDDIEIQVRGDADYEYIDEAWSGATWANVYFNALTKKGQKILEKLTRGKDSALTYQDGLFVPGNSEEAAMVVQKIIAGHKPNWRLNTATKQIYDKKTKSFVHPKGSEKGAYEHSKIYSGKDLNKKNIMDEADDLIASEPSSYHNQTIVHDEYFDNILDQITTKKAEGGRIGYDEGGWTQQDFDKYLEDRKKRDKENRKQDFLDDFEKWKKWKETEGGTLDWAAEGGRIGLQTGGPPIGQGNLTKTIPPKRGPMPQGLPSTLYNGIMRPRSY